MDTNDFIVYFIIPPLSKDKIHVLYKSMTI